MDCSFVYLFGHAVARGVFRGAFDITVINREKLIEEGPAVLVCNHQSFLDPPLIGALYSNPIHFLARKSLTKSAFLRWAFPHINVITVDQARPDPTAIIRFIREVRQGKRVLIFPEGSRTPDGEIKDAMPGIGLILGRLGAGIPVQPLRIEGAYDCLPIHSNKLRLRPITISVGDPIPLTEQDFNVHGREAQRALGGKIMDAIRALPTTV